MSVDKNIFSKLLSGLLKPAVRLALKNGMKFQEINECLKLASIECAKEELKKLSEEENISKVSVITGLQRRDVKRLISNDESKPQVDVMTRVIGHWANNDKYKNEEGKIINLKHDSRDSEFGKLVSEISKDLNPYTVAFELLRIGAVKETKSGLKLIKKGFQPKANAKEAFELLNRDSELLHEAVSENIYSNNQIANLHATTFYDRIPKSKENEIRLWFLKEGEKFHLKARKYLSKLDLDSQKTTNKYEETITASIGTFAKTNEN